MKMTSILKHLCKVANHTHVSVYFLTHYFLIKLFNKMNYKSVNYKSS